jgi:hypothetical protein
MIFPAKEARSVDEKIHFVIFDFVDPGSKRSDRRYCEKNQKFEKRKFSSVHLHPLCFWCVLTSVLSTRIFILLLCRSFVVIDKINNDGPRFQMPIRTNSSRRSTQFVARFPLAKNRSTTFFRKKRPQLRTSDDRDERQFHRRCTQTQFFIICSPQPRANFPVQIAEEVLLRIAQQ